jgi:hypothetical protein
MANAQYQVVELYDVADPVLPRYVCAQRQGHSTWRVTWENRDKLPGKLAAWFRQLASEGREPVERVLLGRGVGLTLKTALALAAFRVAEINRAATGSPDQMADFLTIDPPENVGGRGRPTAVVGQDGTVQTFPSIAALARAAGLARQTVSRAIHRGVPGRGWGEAATPQFYRSTHNCE